MKHTRIDIGSSKDTAAFFKRVMCDVGCWMLDVTQESTVRSRNLVGVGSTIGTTIGTTSGLQNILDIP